MRIWDIDPADLCRQHLLAEHRELHGLWNILTIHGGKGGYAQHPETKRWRGKLKALYSRHAMLVKELKERGFKHHSPLDKKMARGSAKQDVLLDSLERQRQILQQKPCACFRADGK